MITVVNDAYSFSQKKCHFWSGHASCEGAFQLSLWTDTKERVKTAKAIQLQRLISV